MTYRVLYGETIEAVRERQPSDAEPAERFGTETEALNRARELLAADDRNSVAVCDGDGNVLGGVRLQLKLGHFGN